MGRKYPYTFFETSNGIPVHIYKTPSLMAVDILLYFNIGSSYESQNNQGITHLLEHMAFNGTKNYPTASDLSKAMQRIGAAYNAWVSRDHTRYWINLPYNKLERGLEMLHEIAFEQLIEEEELAKEKNVIVSEYNDFWSNPINKFYEINWQNRFTKNHPYTFRALGRPESFNKQEKDDILKWKSKYFVPANSSLIIAGDVEAKPTRKLLDKIFISKKQGKRIVEPKFSSKIYSNFHTYLQKENQNQIRYCLSFPTFGYKELNRHHTVRFNTLSYILGGGLSSRLLQRLREKDRLIYGIGVRHHQMPWAGEFEITGLVSSERLIATIKGIKEELDKLADEGIGGEELSLTKDYLLSSNLIKFDSTKSICYSIGSQVIADEKIWFPDDYEKEIERIKGNELQKMAKQYIDYENINLGFMGKLSDSKIKEIEDIIRQN